LKDLTGRVTVWRPEHIHRAAFLFADMKVIIKALYKNKMLGPPVLQSTLELNEAGPYFNTQAKTKGVKTNVLNIVN
jgi:hypothetical protein